MFLTNLLVADSDLERGLGDGQYEIVSFLNCCRVLELHLEKEG